MLRTVFSSRLVGLHLVAIAALAVFGLLGRWQLGVFEDSGRPMAARDPAPVAVSALSSPGVHITADAVDRRVTAEGVFDASRSLLIAQRDDGFWLLTALDLGDGTQIPVVRGWVARADDPAVAAVPTGRVTVAGRLRPPEQVDEALRRVRTLPAGQMLSVSTAELINVWPGARLRDGYVVATGQTPAPAVAAGQVPAPAPITQGEMTWRNLAYAANWWIFGVFTVFMWFHYIRDAHRRRVGELRETEHDQGADSVALSESSTR
ncbi:SURF1 family protein [Spongiactinospora sp. TRM90649]|uniref:SURF1 family protein n=1 Tax=Spongiactinospora sp. TRM90649 TaxID=3031114 RepID=UPI0023F953BD|nr:SURF1 family protein [Spongiactinospora sp. TRM90649]MDF5751040.1 SURF1 family protein [Spongiactinospora sp. TRM90649]